MSIQGLIGPGQPQNSVEDRMSTTALLDVDEVFTSDGVQVTDFLAICVSTFSDVDGVLEIQFSPDGTNWDFIDSTVFKANTENALNHVVMVSGKFCRILETDTFWETPRS